MSLHCVGAVPLDFTEMRQGWRRELKGTKARGGPEASGAGATKLSSPALRGSNPFGFAPDTARLKPCLSGEEEKAGKTRLRPARLQGLKPW